MVDPGQDCYGARGHLTSSPRPLPSPPSPQILNHRNEWWIPGKIATVRAGISALLAKQAGGEYGARDLMLLDSALEAYFRTVRVSADLRTAD